VVCGKLIQQHFQFFQFKNLSLQSLSLWRQRHLSTRWVVPVPRRHNIPADFGKSLIFVTKADESMFVMILPKSG